MTNEELKEKLERIQKLKCETQTLELKAAQFGCPKRLYDTLSSFSNQDEGGIIIFGVDEEHDYAEVGVYDPQDIQKKINEQCLQMEPIVRPLLSVLEKNDKCFVSAEIPGIDITERPCYYRGKGRMQGAYTRIGDSDEPMTEYEVYSFEAFRKKYQDDIREIPRATFATLNQENLADYMVQLKTGKPHFAALDDNTIYELMSITRNNVPTLTATLLFSQYPQAYFPQLCITAVAVSGTEIGAGNDDGERFLDNQRIEGTIPEMLSEAMAFVRRNMKTKTIISPTTGLREDRTEYPIPAVREAILNALVHRDYSIHTEGMPIQLQMFDDRLEIRNPGGIYGKIKISQLGKVQPDTRNPVLATALETLDITENRYSGIPTIRSEIRKYGLPDPLFSDARGQFTVVFYKENSSGKIDIASKELSSTSADLIAFCKEPRTRTEIAEFLGVTSVSYAIKTYVTPLVKAGLIKLSIPDTPRSHSQLYYSE